MTPSGSNCWIKYHPSHIDRCFSTWSRMDNFYMLLQLAPKPHGELTRNSSHAKHFIWPSVAPHVVSYAQAISCQFPKMIWTSFFYVCARALVGAGYWTSWESKISSTNGECKFESGSFTWVCFAFCTNPSLIEKM